MRTAYAMPFLLIFISLVGWVINLCHVVWFLINKNPTVQSITVRFIFECIGIVVGPLGVLMGWLHLFF